MAVRSYGQYCGLAYALELVGERWALLIVRDLILGPKRFTDLNRGLPGIPSNVLSARLKELEERGIVRRRLLPSPARSIVYELTEYGQELEDILLRLGLWGARSLRDPRAGDMLTPAALLLALRASFRPDAARKLQATYEVRVGEVVVHARVDNGLLEVAEGSLANADLVIETDQTLRSMMSGEISPEDAVEAGRMRVTGDRDLLARFAELFRLPPPVAAAT
jgi:DNA-binding HxlR family transcriptional regulator